MKNSYTLITGASEGFGSALAVECASRAMNLVLVALPDKSLDRLGNYLRSNFDVDVITFGVDLCKPESAAQIVNLVRSRGINIKILINNAGMGNTYPFDLVSPAFYEKQVLLNVLSVTLLTRELLPVLRQNTNSNILNVASLAAFFTLPQKCVYSATKSYIYTFSRSLALEQRKTGVKISVLCPGGMNTNLGVTLRNRSAGRIAKLSIMSQTTVAKIAIDKMLKGQEVIIPGNLNRTFLFLNHITPPFLKKFLVGREMKSHLGNKDYNIPALASQNVFTIA